MNVQASVLPFVLLPVTIGGVLGMVLPAAAESLNNEALVNESVEAVLSANQSQQTGYDLFVSVAFLIVIGCLAVVTLGVAYLSLRQFLDAREEDEDQAKKKIGITGLPQDKSKGKGSATEVEEEPILSLRRSTMAKRDKTKGFGAVKEEVTPREF